MASVAALVCILLSVLEMFCVGGRCHHLDTDCTPPSMDLGGSRITAMVMLVLGKRVGIRLGLRELKISMVGTIG